MEYGYDQIFVGGESPVMDSIEQAAARRKTFGEMTQKFREISDKEKAREAIIHPDPFSRIGLIRKYIRDQVTREVEKKMRRSEGMTDGSPDFMMILLVILIVFCAISHMKVFTLTSELRRVQPPRS